MGQVAEKTKHTPGPWRAGRPDMATVVDGIDSKWIYSADEQYVAVCVEVSWSPTLGRFHVTALLRNGEDELFCISSRHLSDALENFAEEIRRKYE